MDDWQWARCWCDRQTTSLCTTPVSLWPWKSQCLKFCKPRSELNERATLVLSRQHTRQLTKCKSNFFSQACAGSQQLLQPFYRVDVVLFFKETNHKMHWSAENTLPCTGECAVHQHIKLKWWLIIGGIFCPLAILLWKHQALAFVCCLARPSIILYSICHTLVS